MSPTTAFGLVCFVYIAFPKNDLDEVELASSLIQSGVFYIWRRDHIFFQLNVISYFDRTFIAYRRQLVCPIYLEK
jgi:hypothetical protein